MDPSKFCFNCLRENAVENCRCRFCGKSYPIAVPIGVLPSGIILKGRYLTCSDLGIGGYGITYRAYDLVTKKAVAIKEYRPKLFCERAVNGRDILIKQPEEYRYGLNHFNDEVNILISLQNIDNIVRISDSFQENNTAYYVMEYLEGTTLQEFLNSKKDNRITYTEAVKLLIPAILSLHKVHEAGTLHRDISPDNIFICKDGRVCLIDFGASRTDIARFSNSFMPVEKEGYSPPEQHTIDRDGANQGPWSDVYAMSGTIYRCVIGRKPPASSARIAGDPLETPKWNESRITAEQFSVLEKNLSLKITARCKDMLSFAKDLIGALSETDRQDLKGTYPLLSDSKPIHDGHAITSPKSPQDPPKSPQDSQKARMSQKETHNLCRRIISFIIDIILFQAFFISLCFITQGNPYLWLAIGYCSGTIIIALMTKYLGSSPGQIICRLRVTSYKNELPKFFSAFIYSMIRGIWIILPAELIYYLISRESICTHVSGCKVVNSDSSVEISPSRIPELTMTDGLFKGSTIILNPGSYIFGRNPEMCNMVYPLNYLKVSRTHFKLDVDEQYNIFITDKSSYGTWLNNSRLPKNEKTHVSLGSQISFGNNTECFNIN